MHDAIEQFRTAIHNAGLHPPEVIEPDGKLHRFASNDRRSDDAGWYVFHHDGIPAGAFGDWRGGLSETWRADIGRALSPQEEAAHRARVDAMRREREAEDARRKAEAREKASVIWQAAEPASDEHPYLVSKGVKAHGLRVHGGALVVPIRDNTELHSLQSIAGDGEKRFLAGGRVSGCYFPIGKPDAVLCIAEGYATGASIHEATGYAVAVAFTAGNLRAVAESLRAKLPDIRIIVCGDNDESSVGQKRAREAARAVSGLVTIPSAAGMDWNDVHRQGGDLIEAIENAERVKGDEYSSKLDDFRPRKALAANVVTLANVAATDVEWLWPNRLALGKLSIIAGDPGLGKSILSLAIAAHVSLGSRWPVDNGNAPRGDVILLSAEDDLADTIRPRLDAAGADVRRIHALTMIRYTDESGELAQRMFSLEKDIEVLDDQLASLPNCKLVVVDPISAYMGAVDSHKNSDVRGLLAPLSELAQRRRVCVLGVTHLNKSGGKAIYRTMGSLAFVAAARCVLGVVKDEDSPERRLVLPVKNNLSREGLGLAYRVETSGNGAPVLAWETEPVSVSIDDALYQDDERSAVDEAADWLKDVLSDGRVSTTELQKLAKQAGHSWRTVRRAKEKIGAKNERDGFGREGKFYWALSIDGQARPSTLATYDEPPANTSFQAPGNGPNSHRWPTADKYGDGHLCDDESGHCGGFTEEV